MRLALIIVGILIAALLVAAAMSGCDNDRDWVALCVRSCCGHVASFEYDNDNSEEVCVCEANACGTLDGGID